MAKKPVCAMAMHPVVHEELLRPDHVQRLDQSTRLAAATPYRNLEQLAAAVPDTEVLITSWGCPHVGAEHLDLLPRLKLIAHMAGSVKGFLEDVVWRRGVLVTNAVAANAIPVAEYTIAAILFANKKVIQLQRFYTKHHENRAPWTREAPNAGNYRRTIGIIGASAVGRVVIERLQPYDMELLVFDPYITPLAARDLGARKVGMTELLTHSDVVSLHAPLLNETRHMLGARELALMRDDATLINTARGQLVDTAALEKELVSGRLNAFLDTTEPEVLPPASPLYTLPNVFLTPHIAGSLGAETHRLADFIVAEVERYARGAALKYLVRRDTLARLA